ncbi:FadR family transcriptional regulator [Mycolicibacterium moriokaense]|nr:FadR family transcriptional regulator [Mycolicibacterium moriokaense]
MTTSDEATREAVIRPLSRAPLVSTSVAEQLLGLIVDGTFGLGERLPSEMELARDFAVSRPSVREALAALAFAGHVESRRGFGTIVISKEPSPDRAGARAPQASSQHLESLNGAVDLLELRLVLEPSAMASAAVDPDLAKLDIARSLIDGMRVAVEDPGLRVSSDIRVHRALLDVCRNTMLARSTAEVLELSLDPLLLEARTQAWASPELPLCWADQHLAVCDAIAAGDPERARAASRDHLASVVDNFAVAAEHDTLLLRRISAFMSLADLTTTPTEGSS